MHKIESKRFKSPRKVAMILAVMMMLEYHCISPVRKRTDLVGEIRLIRFQENVSCHDDDASDEFW